MPLCASLSLKGRDKLSLITCFVEACQCMWLDVCGWMCFDVENERHSEWTVMSLETETFPPLRRQKVQGCEWTLQHKLPVALMYFRLRQWIKTHQFSPTMWIRNLQCYWSFQVGIFFFSIESNIYLRLFIFSPSFVCTTCSHVLRSTNLIPSQKIVP